jgi:hypothetical protein
MEATLSPQFGWLSVTTIPAGLPLKVNGKSLNSNAFVKKEMEQGGLEILTGSPCHVPTGEAVVIRAGEHKVVEISPPIREAGVEFEAFDTEDNPKRATIFADGVQVGEAPGRFAVPFCTEQFRLTAKDGRTWSGRVSLIENEMVKKRFTLKAVKQNKFTVVRPKRAPDLSVTKAAELGLGRLPTVPFAVSWESTESLPNGAAVLWSALGALFEAGLPGPDRSVSRKQEDQVLGQQLEETKARLAKVEVAATALNESNMELEMWRDLAVGQAYARMSEVFLESTTPSYLENERQRRIYQSGMANFAKNYREKAIPALKRVLLPASKLHLPALESFVRKNLVILKGGDAVTGEFVSDGMVRDSSDGFFSLTVLTAAYSASIERSAEDLKAAEQAKKEGLAMIRELELSLKSYQSKIDGMCSMVADMGMLEDFQMVADTAKETIEAQDFATITILVPMIAEMEETIDNDITPLCQESQPGF